MMKSAFGFSLGSGFTLILFIILLSANNPSEPTSLPVYIALSLFHYGLAGIFVSETGGLK